MVTNVEQIVATHFKVIDAATGPLAKIAANADRAAKGLDHAVKAAGGHGGERAVGVLGQMASVLSNLGGLGLIAGAGLSFHSALESTTKYMENIKQIRELTGSTAMETDFMFSNARRAGVAYDSMQRTMFQLSRRGSMLEQTMAAAGGKVPGMEKKFERLGVVISKGPVKAMETMAAAAKKGKLDAGDLQAQFRIPAKDSNDMLKFLKQLDPKELAKARKGGGGWLTNKDIEAFDKMQEAQHRVADTWNRIKVSVISNLYPIAADMAETLATKMESWLPKVQNAMSFIREHMDEIVKAAKVFATVMTGKKLLDVAQKFAGPAGFLGKMAQLVSGAATIGVGAGAGPGGMAGVMGIIGSIKLVGGVLVTLLPVFVALAAVAGLVYLGFQAIKNNIDGVGDRFTYLWDTVVSRFELMFEIVQRLIEPATKLFGGDGSLFGDLLYFVEAIVASTFLDWLARFDNMLLVIQAAMMTIEEVNPIDFILMKIMGLGDAFKYLVFDPLFRMLGHLGRLVEAVVIRDVKGAATAFLAFQGTEVNLAELARVTANQGAGAVKDYAKLFTDNLGKAQQATDTRSFMRKFGTGLAKGVGAVPEDKKPPKVEMNFPNARFDITQNFAEGFDPDRVAVAFANDLSSLGEMRSSSTSALATMGVR